MAPFKLSPKLLQPRLRLLGLAAVALALLAGERVVSWAQAGSESEQLGAADKSGRAALLQPQRTAAVPLATATATAATATATASTATTASDDALPWQRLLLRQQQQVMPPKADLFASTPVKAASAPAPVAPAAPAAVVAPRFPYAYVAALQADGVRTVFVLKGDAVLGLRIGDVVDGKFRVDALTASTMTLTYLPLDEPQTVSWGAPR